MIIRDILEAKGSAVVTIEPSDTIAALSRLLQEYKIGAAVVSSDGKTIEGVISERDIALGVGIHEAALPSLQVSELMTRTVITCAPNDPVARVASTMLSRRIRHLPVEDDGKLVGMVSIRDILNERVDELQQTAARLRSFANEAAKDAAREQQDRG